MTLFLCIYFIGIKNAQAQFGVGAVFSNDFYQRFTNPTDDHSSGNVLTNLAIGPKIWVGKPGFSFSVEAQAGIGFLGFDASKYKGIGMSHFPIIGSFNFKGTSGFGNDLKKGFSLGGGIQYNRTELFGLTKEFKDQGITRSYFPTYIIQAGGGIGFNGFVVVGFLRYGFHPDTKANSLNIGLQTELNVLAFRKNLNNPNSSL